MDMERLTAVAIKAACAAGTFIIGLMGGWDLPLQAMVLLMALDYVGGLLVASERKSPKTPNGGLSSSVSYRGLKKKAMVLVLLIMAEGLDRLVGMQTFRIAVVCFYAANEGLSIMENAALLGLPLPDSLKKALEDLKKKKIETGFEKEDDHD